MMECGDVKQIGWVGMSDSTALLQWQVRTSLQGLLCLHRGKTGLVVVIQCLGVGGVCCEKVLPECAVNGLPEGEVSFVSLKGVRACHRVLQHELRRLLTEVSSMRGLALLFKEGCLSMVKCVKHCQDPPCTFNSANTFPSGKRR